MFMVLLSCCLALIGFSAFLGKINDKINDKSRQITTKIIRNQFANQFESRCDSFSSRVLQGFALDLPGFLLRRLGLSRGHGTEELGGGVVKLSNPSTTTVPTVRHCLGLLDEFLVRHAGPALRHLKTALKSTGNHV